LKGKEYKVLMSDYDVELTPVYKKDDVEVLREKLIEDFIEFIDYIVEHPSDIADASKTHIEIINKRFGVE